MENEYYWLNEKSRTFLDKGYLKAGQTAEERIKEISDCAEKILGISEFSKKFENYMKLGYFSLSSPIWANFGAGRGLSISCNGSYINDTMDSILEKSAEIGMMTKHGAGTSAFFGDLRPRGANITTGGKSSGPVYFMQLFETITNIVSQSNVRRGSFAAYLDVEHPDIEEFLEIRGEGHPIQHLSIGICITDKWMNSMIDGDKNNRKIWAKIIQKRFESGYPYIFFTDTVNKNAPQVYKDKGIKIYASNLCVTGDTKIELFINKEKSVTIRIEDLSFYLKKYENVEVKSYDVDKQNIVYSKITDFAQTGESKELIEIEDEKGNILRCTPEHKIYTKNRGYIEAQSLKEDDILENN